MIAMIIRMSMIIRVIMAINPTMITKMIMATSAPRINPKINKHRNETKAAYNNCYGRLLFG
jgi:hypothetical protein